MASTEKKFIRTFFACDISEPCRQAAKNIIDTLRIKSHGQSIKWVSFENLHLTLRFIGETAIEKIDLLEQNVAQAIKDISPFSLSFGQLCAFPVDHPHILAISIHLSEPLAHLYHTIEQSVIKCGFAAETRAFFPHITLGRIPYHSHHVLDMNRIATVFPSTMLVKEITLFRSEIHNHVNLYTPLTSLPLAGKTI